MASRGTAFASFFTFFFRFFTTAASAAPASAAPASAADASGKAASIGLAGAASIAAVTFTGGGALVAGRSSLQPRAEAPTSAPAITAVRAVLIIDRLALCESQKGHWLSLTRM